MPERETISVNFGRPVPVFPLDGVVLLPQQVLPLHIFEERYVQMVSRVLDGSGQIALAVFEGDDWKKDYDGVPPIRPYVCLGQIAQPLLGLTDHPLPEGHHLLRPQMPHRYQQIQISTSNLKSIWSYP